MTACLRSLICFRELVSVRLIEEVGLQVLRNVLSGFVEALLDQDLEAVQDD